MVCIQYESGIWAALESDFKLGPTPPDKSDLWHAEHPRTGSGRPVSLPEGVPGAGRSSMRLSGFLKICFRLKKETKKCLRASS